MLEYLIQNYLLHPFHLMMSKSARYTSDAYLRVNVRSQSTTADMSIEQKSITVMDIENAQVRQHYQSLHPIPETYMTYRNHRVLTPQEF